MSEDKADIILSLIRETRLEIAALHEKVNSIALNGCSKGSWHDDHENRMRAVECVLSKASGAMAAIIAISGVVGAITGWASQFLKGDK